METIIENFGCAALIRQGLKSLKREAGQGDLHQKGGGNPRSNLVGKNSTEEFGRSQWVRANKRDRTRSGKQETEALKRITWKTGLLNYQSGSLQQQARVKEKFNPAVEKIDPGRFQRKF